MKAFELRKQTESKLDALLLLKGSKEGVEKMNARKLVDNF